MEIDQLNQLCSNLEKLILVLMMWQVVIGPATVGGIQAGAFKIGDTAGTIDNIIQCKLYRPGSVGFVSKSVCSHPCLCCCHQSLVEDRPFQSNEYHYEALADADVISLLDVFKMFSNACISLRIQICHFVYLHLSCTQIPPLGAKSSSK